MSLKQGYPASTVVVRGAEEAADLAIKVFSNAEVFWHGVSEAKAAAMATRVELYRNLYQTLVSRGVDVLALTEITTENLKDCRELLRQHLVSELRHLPGIKGNFVVSEKEYLAVAAVTEHAPVPEMIYSSDKQIVSQNQYVFDNLWSKGVPAEVRFRELEEGLEPERTEVVRGVEETTARIIDFFSRAESELGICATAAGPSVSMGVEAYRKAFLDLNRRGVAVRYITEITGENLAHTRELMKLVELRHLDGLKSNFAQTEREYTATTVEMRAGELIPQMLYSNARSIVEQQRYMFDLLWRQALPAEQKVRQLEQGVEPEETRVIDDMNEAKSIRHRATEETRQEVLMILAFGGTILSSRENLEALSRRQAEAAGLKVRILYSALDPEAIAHLPGAVWRRSEPMSIGVAIYDRKKMFLVEYKDAPSGNGSQVYSNVYTTNRQTIAGLVSLFEAVWKESELREREQGSRKQAQLLQDILTHDIRNYNQASRLSAEILQTKLAETAREDELISHAFNSLLKSIDGSSQLLERAMKLGKVIAQGRSVTLYPVNLQEAIEDSLERVRRAQEEKEIELETVAGESVDISSASVLADDMLQEVFVNLFSNSVNYAYEDRVPIEVLVERSQEKSPETGAALSNEATEAYKISVVDHGPGIPDELKRELFARYLDRARGRGLGLSIVHALVVDRYGGRISLRDTVEGDRAKGTVVEIWLPGAGPHQPLL